MSTATPVGVAVPATRSIDDPVARQTQKAIQLLAASAKRSYDPRTEIDWDAPLEEGKWFLPERLCSLYGTPMWDALTAEQKLVVSREELASSIQMGVWTEHMLMQMVSRYIYDRDVASPQVQFALTEAADEVRHMIMFADTVKKIGTRTYATPWRTQLSGRVLKTFAPVSALWALILLTERMFDRIQRDIVHDVSVQPVVREVFRIHTFEESRHISFARAELETFVPQQGWLARFALQMLLALTVRTFGQEVFNLEMYRRAGLDPQAAKQAALANPNNRRLLKFAASEISEYYRSIGLIGGGWLGGLSAWIWRRAGFI